MGRVADDKDMCEELGSINGEEWATCTICKRDALYAQMEWAERQILLNGIENPEASSSDKRLG